LATHLRAFGAPAGKAPPLFRGSDGVSRAPATLGEDGYLPSLFLIVAPISAGLFTTLTPAASSAAIFSAAVPFPPEMIAPA